MDTQTLVVVELLKRARAELRRQIEDLKKPLTQAENNLLKLGEMIASYEAPNADNLVKVVTTVRPSLTEPLNLRGMSHRQAVVAIAKHNGGTLKAQEAKRLMIQAGIMKDTKNSTHMVHNAIITSDRFDRIGRGEFRLRIPTPPSGTPVAAMAAGVFPFKPPVQ